MSDRVAITDRSVVLHRLAQVAWIQDGVVSPEAFLPRPGDSGRLSLMNKGLNADQSVAAWHAKFPNSPVRRCLTLQAGHYLDLELHPHESPTNRFPMHAEADFSGMSMENRDLVADLLADACEILPKDG